MTCVSAVWANEEKASAVADPAKGSTLYSNGDPSRGILACVACHGAAGNSSITQNPKLAWACPAEWVAGNESWGRNKRTVDNLLGKLELKRPRTLIFPAGSMFWMSPEFRECLLSLNLSRDDFSSTASLDGSLEHGLERFVGSWSLATQKCMYRTQQYPTRVPQII